MLLLTETGKRHKNGSQINKSDISMSWHFFVLYIFFSTVVFGFLVRRSPFVHFNNQVVCAFSFEQKQIFYDYYFFSASELLPFHLKIIGMIQCRYISFVTI